MIRNKSTGTTSRLLAALLGLALFAFPPLHGETAVPEISHVHPDFIGSHDSLRQSPHRQEIIRHAPLVITGENFQDDSLQIMVWDPPGNGDRDFLEKALAGRPTGGEIALPSTPPDEARLVRPMSVEERILVAELSHWRRRNAMLWIGNEAGFSDPYLYHVAKPLWVSDDRLEPGALLRIFGQGLRREHTPNFLALKQGERVVFLQDYGGPFYISYETRLLETNLPKDLELGAYEVYVHNGWGGEYGWIKAGDLEVTEPSDKEQVVFDPRKDFGALGDGQANDTEALQAALDAAAKAGGGVVHLPPGTYRVDQSLRIRSGATLRGSGAENTTIEGVGFEPGEHGGLRMWNSPSDVPASVVLMESHTGMEGLSVRGSVGRGDGGNGLVQTIPQLDSMTFPEGGLVERIRLNEVRLHAPVFRNEYGNPGPHFYAAAFTGGPTFAAPPSRHISILNSEIVGNLQLGATTRADILGNQIRQGSIYAARFFDSLISGNTMRDDPYRFFTYRAQRTYFRSNELYNFGNRRVSGASESFMLHGGSRKDGGVPTAAASNSLTDSRQNWEENQFATSGEFMILITDGRGFGQYRRVVSNTRDTLVIEEPWRVIPDETSEYIVGGFSADSVFYDNFNDGLGRLTLWLDCINITVEQHRDNMAGGIDIWASDRTADGESRRFHPSWYNMIVANEMEGANIYFRDSESPDNVWNGPTLFANYVVDNNLVNPAHRNVRVNTLPIAAIDIGMEDFRQSEPLDRSSGRSQYTFIINNTIAGSTIGIRVPDGVRKSFVLRNDFVDVEYPILDFGSGTVIAEGNRVRFIDPENGQLTEDLLPDESKPEIPRKEKAQPSRDISQKEEADEVSEKEVRPFEFEAQGLRRLIPAYPFRHSDIHSEELQKQGQDNLKQLHQIFQAYVSEHGGLPDAAFYPRNPLSDENSLLVILGEEAGAYLTTPSAGPMFDALGWPVYIWNSDLNGKAWDAIEEPGETWMLMSFSAPHPWLVEHKHAGHRGGINVLFADGTVRWLPADEVKENYRFSW